MLAFPKGRIALIGEPDRQVFKYLYRRLKQGLTWRWREAKVWMRPRLAIIRISLPLPAKRKPHSLSRTLIVSLTSYPPRYATLALTLRSLLRQTVKADRTILWIAHDDFELLPREVRNLQSRGLEIRLTDDTKSYNKILPTLDAFPEAYICTADDDIYYWPTWLEELVDGAGDNGRVVPCHRAHEIAFGSDGTIKPYREWAFDVERRGESERLFPTGVAGALYPPGILSHAAGDRVAALNICLYADDVWLYWIGRRNGARYRTVGRHRKLLIWPGSQVKSLWEKNGSGGNDIQIRNMIDKYGFPADPIVSVLAEP
jgi:hypothetical protein